MPAQCLATYDIPFGNKVEIYGCADEETPENEFEYYELCWSYDGQMYCINEWNLFYEWPTWFEAKELLEQFQNGIEKG